MIGFNNMFYGACITYPWVMINECLRQIQVIAKYIPAQYIAFRVRERKVSVGECSKQTDNSVRLLKLLRWKIFMGLKSAVQKLVKIRLFIW
jgi:hypothetical protein